MPLVLVNKARPRRPPDAAAYALARRYQPPLKRAFLLNIDELRTPAQLRAIGRAVRNKSIVGLYQAVPLFNPMDPDSTARWAALQDSFDDQLRAILEASGHAELARLRLPMSFNLDNPRSVAWLERESAKLVRDISVQTQQALQGLIRSSFVEAIPTNKLARLVRAHIGLLPGQATAVQRRYESSLQQGVPADRATEMMEAHADRLLTLRAENIARTETIAAEAAGTEMAWGDAQDAGLIVPGTTKEWISGPEDHGVCPLCSQLDGVRVGLNEPWVWTHRGRAGNVTRPPLHPSCRCTMALIPPGE